MFYDLYLALAELSFLFDSLHNRILNALAQNTNSCKFSYKLVKANVHCTRCVN